MPARAVDLEMRRPFTYAQAMAAGVSASSLKGPLFRTLFRGVHIHASVPAHPLHRVEAALLIHPPDAFASHVSAGRVHGVPLPVLAEEHVSVFRKQDRRPRPGLRSHVAAHGTPVVEVRGIRVSAALQAFVELAEVLDLVDLVVVGDDLVRRRRFDPAELRDFCERSSHPGARKARRAAAYVRQKVDSPMETRLRMLIVLAVLVEYDGRQHRDDLDQWDHDTDRQAWFDAHGWQRVPVFSRGIYRAPGKTITRVEAALRSRGAVLPRRLSDDWRPYFPGR